MEVKFRIERPGADVVVTLQVYEENDELVCGLRWMEGTIDLKPKAMRAAMLAELATIEQIAKDAGCVEIRHAGDDRGVFLPGYKPFPALRNGRRKRL